jgi:hypothetical protein
MEEQQNTEPGASSSEGDSGSAGEDSDSDSFEGGTTAGGGTLPGTFSNMSITNGTSTPGGVALASGSAPVPSHLRRGMASVTSSNTDTGGNNPKFAKIKAAPRKVYSELAERERKRDQELEDDVEVASSDSDSD